MLINRKSVIVVILLIINLIATSFMLINFYTSHSDRSDTQGKITFDSVENGQYVLYIGTNDKDTYEQVIPTEQSREIINNICAKYVEGYTSSEAQGGWVDEKGVLTQESTLIYTFTYADESDIIAIMDDVLIALNQNSILVERRNISSSFYNRKD